MTFLCENRIAPDGKPRSAASHLGLCCLPMSHRGASGLNELIVLTVCENQVKSCKGTKTFIQKAAKHMHS